jgi:ribonuclease-3
MGDIFCFDYRHSHNVLDVTNAGFVSEKYIMYSLSGQTPLRLVDRGISYTVERPYKKVLKRKKQQRTGFVQLTSERLEQLQEVQQNLGIKFQDTELLNRALTHKSYVHEHRGEEIQHNERLEFFGDAVLKLVVSEYLVNAYPESDEGVLTKIRAAVVSDASLASFAKKRGLGDFLLMSHNEEKTGGAKRRSNLANMTEALLGALYIDGGLDNVKPLVLEFLQPEIARYEEGSLFRDYKSVLQELAQREGWGLPEYKVTKEDGPDHRKVFWVQVRVGKSLRKTRTDGMGKTKKEAEQRAARQALQFLKKGKHNDTEKS